ncbi:MAG: hypothetical protein V1797_06690, partial [Pseudomonadota bacterium]
MDTSKIKVFLFKDSKDSFITELNEGNIPFAVRANPPGVIMASGEVVEIIKTLGDAHLFESLAGVLVAWLGFRKSRMIKVQTKEGQVIHLEGFSVKKVKELLREVVSITAIET